MQRFKASLKTSIEAWLDASCVCCQQQLAIAQHGICSRCRREIKRFAYCGSCGTELAFDTLHCGKCLTDPPPWQRLVTISHFQPPLSDLIHTFKFHRQFQLDRTLARLLLLAVKQAQRAHDLPLPEVLLPVPLHPLRQWQRGYNQATLLARWLSHWLQIPCDDRLLQRIRYTRAQRALSGKQRRNNLKKAFAINPKISEIHYRSVAIIDDVITTGATMAELCRLLQKCGITQIQVWCLCRT
ncbi:amidophosphoribosyltransferase [Testudinibacter sp. TR-2022]|uniref:phosphoribosyltransferase family protein n=1 Tax=Testudinibacter sp. TR-2022 TaxID=2585029 RepID=UPI0011196628|nr:phosphoribosyltransferase family protein [Testudinibacter sp. TR-2022]TNH04077.1 amidophosphoribosyltransferase [Pasteurellaceae bacterium Phil31]TNH09758.1 amidophosphoribosyltransferase [Testudinibacter sp. TR-2022]TNH10979.1 amidophosphoribosyltransferase [Testudinibacter sp. TR-2022]TNH14740.1 amidophosphoribosyltransferase [Testudinibacter sp. TR-2022]TNH20557.1 amidophosphoribosyltransferase [Testudinibacter sp. TR-2022]